MRPTLRRSALALAGALVLAACGGGDDKAATPIAPASTTVATKVNANTATRAELTAAFQAAGISNPSRWAMEVEEYRPYPTNDPGLSKLRQNLAKHKPGPGVTDAIIAALNV